MSKIICVFLKSTMKVDRSKTGLPNITVPLITKLSNTILPSIVDPKKVTSSPGLIFSFLEKTSLNKISFGFLGIDPLMIDFCIDSLSISPLSSPRIDSPRPIPGP